MPDLQHIVAKQLDVTSPELGSAALAAIYSLAIRKCQEERKAALPGGPDDTRGDFQYGSRAKSIIPKGS